MLVYEYVDNGNLEQWLHGDVGAVSPLTWDIRMNIILGTAKGYLFIKLFCIKIVSMLIHECFELLVSVLFVYIFQIGLSS